MQVLGCTSTLARGSMASALRRSVAGPSSTRAALLQGQSSTRAALPRRSYSARSEHMEDASLQRLMRYKRLFGLAVCGSTITAALLLRKRKNDRMMDLLQDCTRLNLDPGHYQPNISLYRYRGCVLPGQIVMSGVLQQLPDFQFRETDVLVASFPKTGTTWVQEVVYMLKHGCQATSGSDATLETRFPYLEYPYPGLRSVEKMTGARCIKTHLPYSLLPPSLHTAGTKVVYVSRNPRDTAVSYYHFVKLLTSAGFIGTFNDFIEDFLNDKVPYSPFFSHVRGYHSQREGGSVLCVTYEQLSSDAPAVVRKIADHLNVAVSEEDVQYVVAHTSFAAMSHNPSVNYEHWKDVGFARTDRGNFLRKGKVGDWQNSLSETQVALFKAWESDNQQHGDCQFVYTLPS